MNKLYQNREWLYQKYVVEKMSSVEIGELCGVSAATICNWLRKYNFTRTIGQSIKIRGSVKGIKNPNYGNNWTNEQRKIVSKKNTIYHINEQDEQLILKKYIEEHKTKTKIAREFNVSAFVICKILKNNGNPHHDFSYAGKNHHLYGKHHSGETKRKISKAHKGKKCPERQIEKIDTYCDYCGDPIALNESQVKEYKRHFCSKYHFYDFLRANPRLHLGKNNPNYHNGISNEPYSLDFNEILRRKIRKRDNYICKECGMTQEENIIRFKEKLAVHHIDYDKDNLNEDDLISLCKFCHGKTVFDREYWTKHFRDKIRNDELDFKLNKLMGIYNETEELIREQNVLINMS